MDDRLTALALVQLVARVDAGGELEQRREELDSLLDGANAERVALELASMLLAVSAASRFPLAAMLAGRRRELLSGGPPMVS